MRGGIYSERRARRGIAARAMLCALLLAAAPAGARLTGIHVSAVEPFADGAAFGETGAYERVRGTFTGELDPGDARNRVIVNLDKAPRNAAGRVEYEADFFILRPVDAARANRRIIHDVTNRGRKNLHWRLTDARLASPDGANDPRTAADAGNGLFFRMGYTMVWNGWDPGAPRSGAGMAMKPIVATHNGAAIVRVIREELMSGGRGPQRKTFRLLYEAATLDPSRARLTVR